MKTVPIERFHNKVLKADCLKAMPYIPDKSIDMILCDLPYGTTACKWDTIIPFDKLWEQYNRIIKDNGAIVLTASQPFTSALVMSNIKFLKHHWIWDKTTGTGFQVAKYRPMMRTEDIVVFSAKGKKLNYYPQMIKLNKPKIESLAGSKSGSSPIANLNKGKKVVTHRYPKNLIEIKRDKSKLHPTQKPVALFEYLIKTYTNEGDIVLDNCAGSGTTGVACQNLDRKYILIEKDEDKDGNSLGYIDIIKRRLKLKQYQ